MADIPCADAAAFVTALASTAVAGDTITLTAGVTYDTAAGFILRNHGGATAITIRSSALASLPAGKRVIPGQSAAMPTIRSTANNTPVLYTAASAGPWTLQGLYITSTANTQQQGLVQCPDVALVSTTSQDTEAELAHDLLIDRCVIIGLTAPTTGNIRGIHADVLNFTLRESYVANFKYDGSDSQALYVQAGRNHLLQNNYLEAAGENLIYGGSMTTIKSYISSNITIRSNHFRKPLTWNKWHPDFGSESGAAIESAGPNTISCTGTACTSTSHGAAVNNWVKINGTAERRRITAVGGANDFTIASAFTADPSSAAWTKLRTWTVKNLFELKTAQNVLVEGNLMENSWRESQDGRAILFSPLNDTGNNPWHRIDDVIFRHNWIRNVAALFYAGGQDGDSGFKSNRTVFAAGSGTITTVGTAATFSQSHGLTTGDVVRLTSGTYGPPGGQSRAITVTDVTHGTLSGAFTVDQSGASWEKWTTLVTDQRITFEHNVFEAVGKGDGGYMWGDSLSPGLVELCINSPGDVTFRHNTVVYSDADTGVAMYIGETGHVNANFQFLDNIIAAGASSPFTASAQTGSGTITTYTSGTVAAAPNVFYGTNASGTGQPAGNFWETNVTNVGFANQAASLYTLTSGAYRAGQAHPASDGTDMGANISAVTGRVFRRHGLGQGW